MEYTELKKQMKEIEPMSPADVRNKDVTYDSHSGFFPEKGVLLDTVSKNGGTVLEIGMNAGHSTEIFLKNGCTVLSFDIGAFSATYHVKEYFDKTYPGKHTLIVGDSNFTVPDYARKMKDMKFDTIFIDGGHEYMCAFRDIENCIPFAKKDTILIVDDVGPEAIKQVTLAWEKCLELGYVKQKELLRTKYKDTNAIKSGIVVGSYNFK